MNISHVSPRFGAKATPEQVSHLQANYGGNLVHEEMSFSYEPNTRWLGMNTQIARPEELVTDSLNLRAWKQAEDRPKAGEQQTPLKEQDAPVKEVFLIFNQPGAAADKVRKLVGKHFINTFNQGHSGVTSQILSKRGMRVTESKDKTIVQIPFQESLFGTLANTFVGLAKGVDEMMRAPERGSASQGPDLKKPTADN